MMNTGSFPSPSSRMLLAITLLMFLAISCAETDPAFSLNGTWYYTFNEDTQTGEIEAEPTYIARSVVLTFDDNGKKGEFYGQTVTNAIQGKYKLSESGSVTFSEIAGGQRGEPEWSAEFWLALESAISYTKTENRLEIRYNDGKNILIFQPEN